MEYKFDNEFRFKNLPDESTPINADNLNKALENTSWLKSQLDGTIEPMNGSSIEINDCAVAMLNKLEIEGKSVQDGEPSPDNPVEIKSVGYTNLFDFTKVEGSSSSTVSLLDNGFNLKSKWYASFPFIKTSGDFTCSFDFKLIEGNNVDGWTGTWRIAYEDGNYSINYKSGDSISIKKQTKAILFYVSNGSDVVGDFTNIILTQGTSKKSFIPYGKYGLELIISNDIESKTTTFTLNEPLRSLPTGAKDLLYIKNGHLFVERNVYSIICDANMNFEKGNVGMHGYCFYIYLDKPTNYDGNQITSTLFSNRFKTIVNSTALMDIGCISKSLQVNRLYFFINTNITSVEQVKNWFTNNRTEIIYDLAEPTIEDLGEIEMPSTYKDKSTITTTDELEPTINLEYVKDTILTNYVEKRLINLIK